MYVLCTVPTDLNDTSLMMIMIQLLQPNFHLDISLGNLFSVYVQIHLITMTNID